VVVGLNRYTESEPSPLMQGADGGILTVDPAVEQQQIEAVRAWRGARDQAAVDAALAEVARVARSADENIMPATIAAARAGATTGEWARTLREAFGEFRAPTGVGEAAAPLATGDDEAAALRDEVDRVSEALGRRIKILVGKPGLDGHSNGAEQIAVRARDAGMDVVYEGIRVVVGGIIPDADVEPLKAAGVAAVYTPKDFDITRIMQDIVRLVAERGGVGSAA
ncbi:MAG: methylmalonyl-CoA mutase family protein, partial [Solirubrobacteraceae bacterium]|nr:methylmalonyl-CoA mutase family protein [Solirubrobacteraceae bacterium]